MHISRVLFICKRGGIYGGVYGEVCGRRSSALENAYDTWHGVLPQINFRKLQSASRAAAVTWLRWLSGTTPLWVGWRI